MGEFLHSGLEVRGSTESLELIEKRGKIAMQCLPVQRSDTIYWVKTQTVMLSKANVTTIHVADYDIWHKRLGHVSPKVLSKMPTSTQKFPWIKTPKFIPVCPSCAKGKMKSQSFPESQSCATRLFELIHLDLKSLPVESYHRFKYFMSSLMISLHTCGQPTSERNLMHLKQSRTSRQWPESSMVQPSKDGESIKGGSLSTPISWIP